MTTIQPIPSPRKPWVNIIVALLYFILYEVIHFAVSIGASLYFMAISPDQATLEATFNQYSNLLMIILDVIVVLSLSVIVLARGKRYFEGMGVKKSRPETLPVAFIAGVGLSCLLGFVMNYVGNIFPEIMEDYSQTMDMTYNMGQIVLYALAGVVGAPLVEELVFRHFMAGRMAKGMPRIAAIAVSSLLFGLVHQHIVQVIYASILGVAMACIYFAYDSILPSILLHAGFNAVSLVSMINISGWSESAQIRFNLILTFVYMGLTFVGVGALVLLLVRRTHPILKSDVKKTPAPVYVTYMPGFPSPMVQWNNPMAMPGAGGNFPAGANPSAHMMPHAETTQSAVSVSEPAEVQTEVQPADDSAKEAEE